MDIFLGTLFGIVCLLLIVVVLLQRGRGGGLGAAFGGGGGSSAFGTRTGDVFTWVTIVLTAAFLLLAIGAVLAHQQDPDRVAMPEFSPGPGPIEEPVYVSISTPTPGVEIWYTLDGEDPVPEESLRYEREPVEVEPGTELRAQAFRPGWRESEVAVGQYPHEAEEPEPEPLEDPDPTDEPDLDPVEIPDPLDEPDHEPDNDDDQNADSDES